MRSAPRLVITALVAAACAAIFPPLSMVCLWAALSGSPQFISTLGWQWGRFSLLARHISNASLHQPNDGETMLQAAWRF